MSPRLPRPVDSAPPSAVNLPDPRTAAARASLLSVTDLSARAILTRAGSAERTFARNDLRTSAVLERFVGRLTRAMSDAGYSQLDRPGPSTNVVLHSIDAGAPRPYRRKAAPTFVIAIAELAELPDDRVELLRIGYPLLVRALANLCVMVSDSADGLVVRFVTLEQGVYGVGPGLPTTSCPAALSGGSSRSPRRNSSSRTTSSPTC